MAAGIVPLFWLALPPSPNPQGPAMKPLSLTRDQASAFARLALKGIDREYPNQPAHVFNDANDAKTPRQLHPAFFGCFDWHSSVHGHWMLVRLLHLFPDLPEAAQIRSVLHDHLTEARLR